MATPAGNGRLFRDRRDAGRVLAGLLDRFRDRSDVVVLGLPRGGVPVAYEVATALGAPLDVFLVRKLGVPGHEELAMGAIASGDVVVVNDDVVRGFDIRPEVIQRVAEAEGRELLRREQAYRGDRPAPDLTGKVVVLVDDGLATGSSMLAAVNAVRQQRPAQIVVAVPAAPESTCGELAALVDEVVCATTPSPFFAVAASYWDFTQTTDDEVRQLLQEASRIRPKPAQREERTELAVLRSELVRGQAGQAQDALLELVGDAQFVLLGEASHGTHEFYAERAALTRRLIEEKGFCAVAVEADWPDAYRVNRFVRGESSDQTAEESLRGFERFPTWMWRNTVVLDFVGWMHERNGRAGILLAEKAGFYGLDLYGLFRSMQEIIDYLETVHPVAAERARERFACFDHFGGDAQRYGYAAAFGAGESCEQEVIDQLLDLHEVALEMGPAGPLAEDELFHAEQSARTVKAAEQYYRTMFGDRVESWNLRDTHMADTLDALAEHLSAQRGEPARIVVWAHNSHVGDSSATELGSTGELTLGGLVRERHPGGCLLAGFTTYTGTVTAADDWGGPAERKHVRPALPGSFEQLFHELGEDSFAMSFRGSPRSSEVLRSARLERAIGVIYRPSTERQSHYFRARLADQFDVLVHVDGTRAVEPLERTARWDRGEVPETFPHAV
jgi:erythromycin esterase-like protein/predicted phosphoribosyltransferase